MNSWNEYDNIPPTIRATIKKYQYGNATRQDIINKLQQAINRIQQDERQAKWKLQQQSLPEHE